MSEIFVGSAQAPPLGLFSGALFVALALGAAFASGRHGRVVLIALFSAIPFNYAHALRSTTVDAAKAIAIGALVSIVVRGKIATLVPPERLSRILMALGFFAAVLDAFGATHAGDAGVCIREAFKALQYVLMFAIAGSLLRGDRTSVAWLASALSGLTIAVSIAALFDEVLLHKSVFSVGGILVTRVAGVLEGPNQLSGYLQLLVPLAVADAMSARGAARRMLSGGATVLGLIVLALTFSRAGIASAALALALTIVLSPAFARLRPAAKAGVSTALAVAIGGAAYTFRVLTHREATLVETEQLDGLATRGELWHAAIVLWQRSPLFGIGAGNYELELPSTGLLGVRTHANNYYLQTLAEGGAVALATAVSILGLALFGLAARARGSWIAAAIFSATAGIVAHQFLDDLFFFPKVGATWWLLLALGLSSAPDRNA